MNNKYIKLLSKIIVFLCLVFIIKTIISLDVDLRRLFSYEGLKYFLPATLILLLNIHFAALIYKRNVDVLSGTIVPYDIIRNIYIKSNIGKYLPGNVMHFAGRNIIGSKYGIGHQALLFSTILLQVQAIFAAILIGFALSLDSMLKVGAVMFSNYKGYLVILFLLGIIGLIAAVTLGKKRYLQNKEIKFFLSKKKNVFRLLFSQLLIICYLFFYALSFLLIINAFTSSLTVTSTPLIISGFIIAWVCGTMVPGAPGGIGVREAVLLLLLSNIVSPEGLMLSVIFHRLSTIVADIAGYLITKLMDGKVEQAYQQAEGEMQ